MGIINNNKDLVSLFLEQVTATPDAVALEDEARSLTYAQLDKESANLAERLCSYGVGRDDLVGVLMGRSAGYVIAALSALRAGGAFLVLEVAYPARLLQEVIDDAKPIVILTQAKYKKNLSFYSPIVVVDSPEDMPKGEALPQSQQRRTLKDEDDLERLMFVSYSSGTTGKPKGIMNPHRAAIRSYDLRFAVSDLKPGDRVACNVFFIWEMLRPLIRGATTVAIPDHASYDPVTLVELLSSWRITDTLMTPTLLTTILSWHPKLGKRLPHLRSLWLNGEVLTTELVRRAIDALPETRLFNVYSACETHETAVGDIRTFVEFDTRVCPVGLPTDPDYTYVLDEAGNAVSQGVEGELYVGGKLLARGYLNLPETTTKSFLPDPFASSKDARMYRTGDLARFLPNGLLEVAGRVGGMIKMRGYTIHPSTVECAILKQLAVRGCSVMAHGEDLERRIVAYIVPETFDARDRTIPLIDEYGHSPTARKALTDCLAQYMIPSIWIPLPELPTNGVSGKVDLKALPAPPSPRPPIPRIKTGSKEQNIKVDRDTIIKLWAASLNMLPKVITSEHDFFDLGGHSLALADLAGRLTNTFGFPVPLSPLAENPSLHGHIKAIKDARDGHVATVEADLQAVLLADSVLPDDIKGTNSPPRSLRDADTILLTGATGYLGGFLLETLVDSTSGNIVCLERFLQPVENFVSSGLARIRENCISLGTWQDYFLERIEILPATLNKERLGLSPTNGEKGLGKKWKHFITMKGIIFNPSPPDTPDQNGPAERSGGVIMTIARKLRIQGNLPQKLWPYIVAHATRLLNRIPVQRKQWRTPFEMVHGRKRNLSHLKIIGSLAYVLIKNKKARSARAKLQENALTGWLVGFDATNIHKVWIPHLDRVIVSRDVQIDEKVMYDPQLATTRPESGQALAITVNEVDLDEEDVEPLPITEDIATSVPVSIQTEVEPPLLGLLLTPQSSPERATAGEIQVEQPDVLRPPNQAALHQASSHPRTNMAGEEAPRKEGTTDAEVLQNLRTTSGRNIKLCQKGQDAIKTLKPRSTLHRVQKRARRQAYAL
ncbi:hypothetical protein FANTH_11110 [Fusarium anthophilum]|uniref:Carrier domain-containing protein n=1 Tax=Fusarium anthophilum TaxID=48485 RepID=A0A8H5DV26_9HYPO|nr:hypothetical protein FANTH_11110 [Fusarium anthophilum]